jgi:hypothetical protein
MTFRNLRLPTFLDGMGSILDLSGAVHFQGQTDVSRSDADALRGDWEAVGNDLRAAALKLRSDEE